MSATVLMRFVRVACAGGLALTAAVSAQTVTPANSTDQQALQHGIELSVVRNTEDGAMVPISHVVPLTARAAEDLEPPGRTGQLFYATDQTRERVNSSHIAYINCDPTAYKGNLQAADVFNTVITNGAIAALFFSQSASYCNVTGIADTNPFVYSMINATTSQQVLEDLVETTSAGTKYYFARIQPSADETTPDNGTMSSNGSTTGSDQDSQSQNNPLGPSPSTAVAMIILYSITGVITALFLVIIITGALRAHRHPERYGPGVVLNGGRGGARQTRVRGIARAMLDTLPVVKFGDQTNNNHPPKPTDVEMGDTTARNSAEEEQQQQRRGPEGNEQAETTMAAGGAETSAVNGRNSYEGSGAPRAAAAAAPTANDTEASADAEAGIAPAAAGSSAENLASEGDAYTGCTICTEEFEPGQDVRVLPCDHKFHPACIDPWLLNVSGTCPLCRIDLNPANPDDAAANDADGNASTRRSASILAPPLSPTDAAAANIPSHHRRSVFRDLLHLRGPASSEERLAMARRMAGERRGAAATAPSAAAADDRRRSRLSTLFRRDRAAAPADGEVPPVPEQNEPPRRGEI
ncbi:hypothetical protein GTA08_BOTSDO05255 [Neofusicoccum parvum]|nr:hypothetical protein GTA08_BOTSDO05255 [Neofusicoccum parvum]